MMLNRLCNILVLGLLTDWSLSLVFVCYQSLSDGKLRPAIWLNLLIIAFVFGYMRAINKIEDSDILTKYEGSLLMINIIAVAFAISVIAVTLGKDWFAINLRYLGVAFGLPSFSAIIYWRILKTRI